MEQVGDLRLLPAADLRLVALTDRNNDGLLTAEEHPEMESLAEPSESISQVRGPAPKLLGRRRS